MFYFELTGILPTFGEDKHKWSGTANKGNKGVVYSMFTTRMEVIDTQSRLAAAQAEIKQNA